MKTYYDVGNAYKELKAWWTDSSTLADVEGCLGSKRPFLFNLFYEAEIIDSRGFKELDATFQDALNILFIALYLIAIKRSAVKPLRKRK